MNPIVGVKPRWFGALAIWAGSDHYSLWQALTAKEFSLPVNSVQKIYRIDFLSIYGRGPRCRYVVAYNSEKRECLVVLDLLPAELASFEQVAVSPVGAAQIFFSLVLREPSAVFSLFFLLLPTFVVMILFLLWMNFVLGNHDLLAVMANENCDANCVGKVLKIHSIVGVLFLTPISLVLMTLGLMIFQAPRYRVAMNYRLAQSFCAGALAAGIFVLAQQMMIFPFKTYGKFVKSGFGPQAVIFLRDHKLSK